MRLLIVDTNKKIQDLRVNPYFNDLDDATLQEITVHMSLWIFKRVRRSF